MPPQSRLSVRLSHACFCVKTAELEILSVSDRPIILVFRHQGSLRKSDGFTPKGVPNTMRVAIFDQYPATSRKQ